MKGIEWNGDYFAEKGMCRSDGKYMFSVGNLVSFSVTTFCSPDGRSHSHGCIPASSNYKLQEEIILEEFNKTETSRFNSGSNNVQKIVELEDVFWHEYSTPIIWRTFLLQVLNDNKNVFHKEFIGGGISEVRNNSDKFLHIYEIPEGYRSCKAENFEKTVHNINLQKKEEEQKYEEIVLKNFRGVELVFGITSSGWYESRASFGHHSVQLMHEHDSTSRSHHKIVIMPCVPSNGHYDYENGGASFQSLHFYMPDGTPIELSIFDNGEPRIDTMTNHRWNNSQSWWYEEIQTLEVEKGWVFIDGVDVYGCTKKIIEENKIQKITTRNEKFASAKEKAIEVGFTDVQIDQLIKVSKGQIIANINLAISMVVNKKLDVNFVLQIFTELRGKSTEIISGYSFLVSRANEIKMVNVKKVAEKAYAWAYVNSLIPGFINSVSHFDEAMVALNLAIENKVPFNNGSLIVFEEKGESDLAVLLREAGLSK